MKFHRKVWPPRTVWSESGGIQEHGRFSVSAGFRKLTYAEADKELTLPLDLLKDKSVNVGTALIRRWEGSQTPFTKEEVATIQQNIFDALDHMRIRYANTR